MGGCISKVLGKSKSENEKEALAKEGFIYSPNPKRSDLYFLLHVYVVKTYREIYVIINLIICLLQLLTSFLMMNMIISFLVFLVYI